MTRKALHQSAYALVLGLSLFTSGVYSLPSLDTDTDGMPDYWECVFGLDEFFDDGSDDYRR